MPELTEQVYSLPIWKSFLSFLYHTCLRFSLFSNISKAPLKFSKPRGKKKGLRKLIYWTKWQGFLNFLKGMSLKCRRMIWGLQKKKKREGIKRIVFLKSFVDVDWNRMEIIANLYSYFCEPNSVLSTAYIQCFNLLNDSKR